MESKINGLHHITALASDPQANYDFYTDVLGLRLVKKTVNFDAPDVYHFYFADELGTPGTVLTFFPFPNAAPGKRGIGEAASVTFSIPRGSMGFWYEHLPANGVDFDGPRTEFGRDVISFSDPDGMTIVLTEDDVADLPGWRSTKVPREHSIRKFFGTTLALRDDVATVSLLTDVLGLSRVSEDTVAIGSARKTATRYASGEGDHLSYVDIVTMPDAPRARQSAGSIHHIAWRTENDESQLGWRETLEERGYRPTPVIDRNYFHSVYFREPGGVLFEIATDNPGFTVDEDLALLGRELMLPEQYEPDREQIEGVLIPLKQDVVADQEEHHGELN